MIQKIFGTVFWVMLLAIGCRAVLFARSQKWELFSRWWITTVAVTFSIFAIGLALYIGYVAPLSIMQDIVVAQQGLQGKTMHTRDVKQDIEDALEKEPFPYHLMTKWPELTNEALEEYNSITDRVHEAAHPPFMVLFISPFVYFTGIRGTFLIMAALSLIFMGVSFMLIFRGLDFKLRSNQFLLVFSIFLGWAPMYWVLRGGQVGAILCGLIVLSWYCIRRGRQVWGGIAVGIAASLKAFPALLLVYFLFRHRKALISSVLTIVVLNLITMAFWGEQFYIDWIQTARYVGEKYAGAYTNYSLLSALHSLSEVFGLSVLSSSVVFLALSMATVAFLCWVVMGKRMNDSENDRFDLEYSLFVAAMPLLSPISWFHYFVVLPLPLSVLAKTVIREKKSEWSVSFFVAVLLILSIPPPLLILMSSIIKKISWRLSLFPFLLPTLAMIGIVGWISILAKLSSVHLGYKR